VLLFLSVVPLLGQVTNELRVFRGNGQAIVTLDIRSVVPVPGQPIIPDYVWEQSSDLVSWQTNQVFRSNTQPRRITKSFGATSASPTFFRTRSHHDLSGRTLARGLFPNANLSGWRIVAADFFAANLTGANLSEADLSGSDFRGASARRRLSRGGF
jgi:hypothetical protein